MKHTHPAGAAHAGIGALLEGIISAVAACDVVPRVEITQKLTRAVEIYEDGLRASAKREERNEQRCRKTCAPNADAGFFEAEAARCENRGVKRVVCLHCKGKGWTKRGNGNSQQKQTLIVDETVHCLTLAFVVKRSNKNNRERLLCRAANATKHGMARRIGD